MTLQVAPYVLLGMEGAMLVGGVWLVLRAIKTWWAERSLEAESPGSVTEMKTETRETRDREELRPRKTA